MKSEEIVVKNEPVYVDTPFGRPTRSVKRPISRQQHSGANTSKTTSKQSKSTRQDTQSGKESQPIEVQVKNEPATNADDESLTESSHTMVAISFLINTGEPAVPMMKIVKDQRKSKKTKKIKLNRLYFLL